MDQERLADAFAALRRTNEQVLQINAGPAGEGRKIVKPDREADRLAGPFRDLAIQLRIVAEQRRIDHRLGRLDLVVEFLVLGELAYQGQYESRFTWTRTADGEGHSLAHTATSALMCGCGS